MIEVIATLLLSYLLGAVPFGLIVARLSGIDDIRKLGSGNIGATNVWRIAGAKVAVWVFVFDIGKGAVAVLIAQSVYNMFSISIVSRELFLAVCGTASVMGHVFPIYLKFKGGKGVNTALGVIATLLPVQTIICFGAFVITLILTRYVSLGSIFAAISLCGSLLVQKFVFNELISNAYLVMALVLGIVVIFAHRKNIGRIVDGTENRFNLKTKTSGVK